MALKPDIQVKQYAIDYFMYETATRGGIVVHNTGVVPGSGAAMDNAGQRVVYVAQPSGRKPLGLLLNDVVNVDLARQVKNYNKSEAQVGEKVTLMVKGTCVTNMFANNGAPATGAITLPCDLFLGPTGTLTIVNSNYQLAVSGIVLRDNAYPRVGKALTNIDENGYAKVQIEL